MSKLLRDCTDTLGSYGADVLQKAVVLEVVCDDDDALLLPGQHELHVVLNVDTRLNEGGVNVAVGEINDVEAVLQFANHVDDFLVALFLLIDRNKLRHAKRRDIKALAGERIEVMQTVVVALETRVAAVSTDEDVGVHEDVVRVEGGGLLCHGVRKPSAGTVFSPPQ